MRMRMRMRMGGAWWGGGGRWRDANAFNGNGNEDGHDVHVAYGFVISCACVLFIRDWPIYGDGRRVVLIQLGGGNR